MLRLFRRNAKGFTLIELLIVVAIIGILAAIAIPNLLSAQRRSKISRAAADSKQMVTQTQLYINDNNTYPNNSDNNPSFLWDSTATDYSAKSGVLMAKVFDPFGTTSTTHYRFKAAGVTADIMSWSVGPDGASSSTAPTATAAGSGSGDDIGYSATNGAFGS